jgi:nicotinic acid mononucleotide adenylyltransferase
MAAAQILCYPRIGGNAVGYKHRNITPMQMPPVNLSSGLIRERLAESKAINGMTPLPVIKYIKEHKLYV